MTLEYRRYTRADEPGALALLEASLGWVPDDQFRNFFRWKHYQNPFGESPAWIAVHAGEIVGFRIFLRWEWVIDGAVVRAVRAVDTATHPDHRGRGIFKRLTMTALEGLRAEDVAFVFNTPNDQSRPGYLKMGWVSLGRVPMAVRPRVSLRSWSRLVRSRTAAAKWSEPCEIGTDAPTFFAENSDLGLRAPVAGLSTNRSDAYFRWRYGFDALRYRVVTDGSGAGVVLRVRRRGPSIETTITDVLGDPRQARPVLRGLNRAVGSDYAIGAASCVGGPAGYVRARPFSPIMVWRALSWSDPPRLADLSLSLGDVELF